MMTSMGFILSNKLITYGNIENNTMNLNKGDQAVIVKTDYLNIPTLPKTYGKQISP